MRLTKISNYLIQQKIKVMRLAISLALDGMRPSINRRYYQYCCVEGLAAFLDVCSNAFAVLTAILENSFISSCSIIVFNASIFANMTLFASLVVTIALSAKLLTVLA
jgi:hypothetical protein